jgi:hypothetical protein
MYQCVGQVPLAPSLLKVVEKKTGRDEMCSLRSLQYNMEMKHEIYDEGGENKSTMEMVRIRLNCEVRKTARGGKVPAKNKQTGCEIEAMRRAGANMRGSGTIDDIRLGVVLDTER